MSLPVTFPDVPCRSFPSPPLLPILIPKRSAPGGTAGPGQRLILLGTVLPSSRTRELTPVTPSPSPPSVADQSPSDRDDPPGPVPCVAGAFRGGRGIPASVPVIWSGGHAGAPSPTREQSAEAPRPTVGVIRWIARPRHHLAPSPPSPRIQEPRPPRNLALTRLNSLPPAPRSTLMPNRAPDKRPLRRPSPLTI